MKNKPFTPIINLHTHQLLGKDELGLISHSIVDAFSIQSDHRYSVGLHPYDIARAENNWLEELEKVLQQTQVVAIGECGIDHAIDVPIYFQTELFENQILLAEKNHVPMIIHAVRSYFELIYLYKKHKVNQAWVIHAYNGNLQTTHQLLPYRFYFSIGEALLKYQKDWYSIINTIPIDRVFIETDNSQLKIEKLYQRVAEIYAIDVELLKEQVYKNFIDLLS